MKCEWRAMHVLWQLSRIILITYDCWDAARHEVSETYVQQDRKIVKHLFYGFIKAGVFGTIFYEAKLSNKAVSNTPHSMSSSLV
jgi:hypothetical protein